MYLHVVQRLAQLLLGYIDLLILSTSTFILYILIRTLPNSRHCLHK